MTLQNISRDGIYSIVALDHRDSMRQMINPENPGSVSRKLIEKIKMDLAGSFSKSASGILLDSEYGIPAMKLLNEAGSGLILSMESTGYEEKKKERITSLLRNFNPQKAVELGADAAKVVVFYNKRAKSAKHQKELVKNLAKECKEAGLPLICEVLIYMLNEKNFAEERPKMIIDSAKEFSRLGIGLLKAEFPGNVKTDIRKELDDSCKGITEASKVEWVLLSRGVPYHEFREELRVSIAGGAKGFVVGRSLWQEYFGMPNEEDRMHFLRSDCARRLEELRLISSKGK
jgi:tagatose 1,6-diphosphate aldolase